MICVNLSKPIYFSKNSYELDNFKKEDDLDKNLLYEFFVRGEDLEKLRVFKLNNLLIVVGRTIFASYIMEQGFKILNINNLTKDFILEKLIGNVEEPDGLDLVEHYDIINKTLDIDNRLRVPLSEMRELLNQLSIGNKHYESKMYIYTLNEDEDNYYIDKAKLPKLDANILEFLLDVQAKLVDVYSLQINGQQVLYYGNYIIKYTDITDMDYLDLRESTPIQILEFLHIDSKFEYSYEGLDTKRLKSIKVQRKTNKNSKGSKSKSNKEDKGNKKSMKDFLMFLIKKPE